MQPAWAFEDKHSYRVVRILEYVGFRTDPCKYAIQEGPFYGRWLHVGYAFSKWGARRVIRWHKRTRKTGNVVYEEN